MSNHTNISKDLTQRSVYRVENAIQIIERRLCD
jgi:hypothetical protein